MKLTFASFTILAIAAFFSFYSASRASASLILDGTFRPEIPTNTMAVAVNIDSKERIVLALNDGQIMRLLPSGQVDSSFSTAMVRMPGDGPLPDAAPVIGIALQSDGHIVVCGEFAEVNGNHSPSIARFNADGALDLSFQSKAEAIFANEIVFGISPTSADKLFIFSWPISTTLKPRVLRRLRSDGTLDTGFEPIEGTISAHWVGPSDEVILWHYSPAEGKWTLNRYLPNGQRDTSFQADPRLEAPRALFVREDHSILFYGSIASDDGFKLRVARIGEKGDLIESQDVGCDDLRFLPGNLAYLGSCTSDVLNTPNYWFKPVFSEFPEPAGTLIWPEPETKFFPIAQQRAFYVAGRFTRPGDPNGLPLHNDWPLSRFLYITDIQLHTPRFSEFGVVISASGDKGQRHAIEASSDFENWTVIGQASSIFEAIQDPSTNQPSRFYRARILTPSEP